MAWDKKFVDFGVVKIDGKNKVKVYKDNLNYTTISVGSDTITDARWTGDNLSIWLSNGKVKRYKDNLNYTTI